MDRIRVRAYNVLFGDALLVTVPDRDPASGATTVRHILIDVGNALTGKPGKDTVFEPVVTDILKELDGAPLDLYVMTHEHMDHVQGLPYVAKKVLGEDELRQKLQVSHAWFTASAAKGVLEPVHFLKVSHHCSATGMPDDEFFDRILPPDAPGGVPRQAAVSTCDGAYHGIPDTAVTGARLAARCTVRSTFDAPDEPYQDFLFEDGGG
jgi:beta-lactamase superfamily II metal-dependent hydrolase